MNEVASLQDQLCITHQIVNNIKRVLMGYDLGYGLQYIVRRKSDSESCVVMSGTEEHDKNGTAHRRSSSSSSSSDTSVTTPKMPAEDSIEVNPIMRLMDPESPSSPKEIAESLHEMPHADPKMVKNSSVGQVLGEPDAKSLSVLHEYANGFQFENVPFDIALRVYLSHFELPREAQKIDRILQAFAKAYYSSNPDSEQCPSEDAVYTLAFSVLLLNTDAHNPRLARKFKMSRADFIRNYHRLGGDGDSTRSEVPDLYLGQCYDLFVANAIKRIERKPTELLPDEVELEFPEAALGLEIETSFDGRTAVVRKYSNNHHTYSSRRRRQSSGSSTASTASSFLTSGTSFFKTNILANLLAVVDSEPEVAIAGYVIVAVGDDSTRQIGYALTKYLLKTAPRPVLIRFCEPSVYFSSLV
ncbi:Ankyrin repeat [Phytophthora citrophthora]|uniref:Ankyrin repeat n=1 Tax=Phytophthora citrophthora TaxID=4793 RepID=A0AAD9G637_9STRA|nr:Ankyrin repeat [Phytophthora citrophthora]